MASRVANRRSSTSTPALGESVEQGRLAGVRVADDRHPLDAGCGAGALRWVARCLSISRSSASQLVDAALDAPAVDLQLRLARTSGADAGAARRHATGLLGRAVPLPRIRGSRYLSSASSTCALPSWLCAFWAKMSRITAVRSMTLPEQLLEVALLPGRRARCRRRRVGAGGVDQTVQLLDLALADPVLRVGLERLCTSRPTGSAPGRVGEGRQLVQVRLRGSRVRRPTRTAFSCCDRAPRRRRSATRGSARPVTARVARASLSPSRSRSRGAASLSPTLSSVDASR